MKKLMKLFLVLLAALMLIGCAQKTEKPKDGEKKPTEGEKKPEEGKSTTGSKKTYKIGVAIYNFDDNFMTLYRKEIEKYFKEKEATENAVYELDFQDGQKNQAKQTEQLNTFLAQGKDLIIANLVDPPGADTFIPLAKEKNVPVILINREPTNETLKIWPKKTAYIGVNARQSGEYQGQIIADLPNKGDINGDGKVSYIMLLGDTQNVDAQQRTQYSIETLEKSIKTELLGERLRGDWEAAKGQELTANALAQFADKIEVVFANNDGMALGAHQALKAAGRKIGEDVYLVGVDALSEVVDLIEAKEFTGTVLNDHFNQAHTAVEVGIKLLKGEEVSSYYSHEYIKVLSKKDAELKRVEPKVESVEEYTKRMSQYTDKKIGE